MKPLKIEISAMGPYKDKVVIDFEKVGRRGLFLITGPTGAGKTTIFDGISFALYGDTSGSTREKDSLRSDFAQLETETYVMLDFTHKGKEYKLKRNPKYETPKRRGEGFTEKKEDAYLKSGDEVLATGAVKVTEKIKEILGIDYSQFKQISMIAQGEFTELLINSSKDRTKIFRDIFGTGIYEKVRVMLTVRSNQLKADIKTLNSKLVDSIAELETDEELDLTGKSYEEIVRLVKSEIESAKNKEKEISEKVKQSENKIKELIKKINDEKYTIELGKKIEALKTEQINLEKEIEVIKKEFEAVNIEFNDIPNKENNVIMIETRLKKAQEYYKTLKEYILEAQNLKKRQDDFLRAESLEKAAKKEYEYYDELLRKAAIGIAAKELVEGEPCPVCGSLSHPNIAKISEEVTDEKHVEELKKKHELLLSEAGKKHSLAVSSKEILDKYKVNEADLDKASVFEEQIKELKNQIEEIKENCNNIRQMHSKLSLRLENRSTLFIKNTKDIEVFEAEYKVKLDKLATLDEATLKVEYEKQEQIKADLDQKLKKITRIITVNNKFLKLISDNIEKKDKLEQEYGIISDLENISSGRNSRNLIFEQYVLSVYFDAILEAANIRFNGLTSGRYVLSRVKEAFSARSKDSLDIEVFDNYTGKLRGVKSLSGGEIFKAALSLAFGMSDVIQNFSGGVEINTLFIDEGFGALDTESLDQAIAALLGVANDGRIIGIISHVQELKDRIKNQIIIEKTNTGSRIVQ